ncbi:AAA family ATPase, partial [Winogradskyella poriferorum]|uniref:AAA family ATPase n=1 Tax=Winogradskyella poriferorum TaxID=307627 RepID=UPI003D65943B
SETYYSGTCEPLLEEYALKNSYEPYVLSYIETPWEPDDLRDKANERERMFKAFEKALIVHKRPYGLLKANKKERLK